MSSPLSRRAAATNNVTRNIASMTPGHKLPPAASRGPNRQFGTRRSVRKHRRPGLNRRLAAYSKLFVLFLVSFTITNRLKTWVVRIILAAEQEQASTNISSEWHAASLVSSLPAVQVLSTTYGWENPNSKISLATGRSKFQAYLHQGVRNHPWFNPRGWQEYSSRPPTVGTSVLRLRNAPPSTTTMDKGDMRPHIYVFFDMETCYEDNYPQYGLGVTGNSDRDEGRVHITSSGGMIKHLHEVCPFIDHALDSPLLSDPNGGATLVLFDCGWQGPSAWSCLNREHNPKLNERRVSVVSESARKDRVGPLDLGLPPPAIHPVPLIEAQEAAILGCLNEDGDDRPYLFSFTGNFRHAVRQKLLELHDPPSGVFVHHHFGGTWNTSSIGRGKLDQFANADGNYTKLLSQSKFAGVPRGDNLFSYRFTEALSGGSIPVVFADGWLLPFSGALVDWSSIAVFIPEDRAAHTLDYLANLTASQRCGMRKKGYQFYKRYMADSNGVIHGIIESLEQARRGETLLPSKH